MSSTLADFKLEFEDLPQKTRKSGKDSKMSKSTNTESSTPKKKYAKTRGEHYKDIVIAVLVTSIIAFVCGMQFANSNNAKVSEAVNAVTATQMVNAEAKK